MRFWVRSKISEQALALGRLAVCIQGMGSGFAEGIEIGHFREPRLIASVEMGQPFLRAAAFSERFALAELTGNRRTNVVVVACLGVRLVDLPAVDDRPVVAGHGDVVA